LHGFSPNFFGMCALADPSCLKREHAKRAYHTFTSAMFSRRPLLCTRRCSSLQLSGVRPVGVSEGGTWNGAAVQCCVSNETVRVLTSLIMTVFDER
jgi:hypothetical protein